MDEDAKRIQKGEGLDEEGHYVPNKESTSLADNRVVPTSFDLEEGDYDEFNQLFDF